MVPLGELVIITLTELLTTSVHNAGVFRELGGTTLTGELVTHPETRDWINKTNNQVFKRNKDLFYTEAKCLIKIFAPKKQNFGLIECRFLLINNKILIDFALMYKHFLHCQCPHSIFINPPITYSRQKKNCHEKNLNNCSFNIFVSLLLF